MKFKYILCLAVPTFAAAAALIEQEQNLHSGRAERNIPIEETNDDSFSKKYTQAYSHKDDDSSITRSQLRSLPEKSSRESLQSLREANNEMRSTSSKDDVNRSHEKISAQSYSHKDNGSSVPRSRRRTLPADSSQRSQKRSRKMKEMISTRSTENMNNCHEIRAQAYSHKDNGSSIPRSRLRNLPADSS